MTRDGARSGPVLVTGGAGYLGAVVTEHLVAGGRQVRVLDSLIHDQSAVAEELERQSARVVIGDLRDAGARREALSGVSTVVHLAAIVGDPACARDPELSHEVNVLGTKSLLEDARREGVKQLVFASTCSNYGRMADPEVAVDEDTPLRPVSLYAEQKVEIESLLLAEPDGVRPTCLRFATIYGVAPRMRFDLTVNEFTRDLWANRKLDVFGERFWRPYVHVRDAARAVQLVLDAPSTSVGGAVFNVGNTRENYRKVDIVDEVRGQLGRGDVAFVQRDEDPRDYRVSFDRIAELLGFRTKWTLPAGVEELIAALEDGAFGDPFDGRYTNTP